MQASPVRPQKSRRPLRFGLLAGIGLATTGVVLLAVVGAYYGYSIYAGSRLGDLNARVAKPVSLPLDAIKAGFVPVVAADTKPDTASGSLPPSVASHASPPNPPVEFASGRPPPATERQAVLVAIYDAIYPGYQVHPKYWSAPLWAGVDPYVHEDPGLPAGFAALRGYDPVEPARGFGVARRISIPSIGVVSGVVELQILDLGDSLSYETPVNTVGHIPETSNPGQLGNGWFFGHLESPVRGEGNVFQHLPEIPKLLQNGDPVYITIESDEGEFLYQATETVQVHQDDLRLQDTENASITLVACVPRLVYDHRLLVTAELVGVKN